MIEYLCLFSVVAICTLLVNEVNTSSRIRISLLLAIAVMLVFMIGFRNEVGGDWPAYLRYLDSMRGQQISDLLTATDPAYLLLNWIGVNVWGGIYFVNTVSALIFVFGVMIFCQELPKPFVGFLVAVPYLLIVVGMGYTRQSVAVGMAMLAISFIYRGNALAYTICIVVGLLFHQSAVIMLPFLIFSLRDNKTLYISLLFLMGGVAAWYLYPNIDYYLVGYNGVRYQSPGVWVRLSMTLLPSLALFLFRRYFQLPQRVMAFWLVMGMVSWCLGGVLICFPQLSTPIDRVILYLIPLQLMVFSHFSNIFRANSKGQIWVVRGIVVYSGATLLTWLCFANHSKAWVPYHFAIW